jgi:iron complex outermembrane recepter protein
MFNLRARYDIEWNTYHPFAWIGASHIGPMTNEPRNFVDGNLYAPTTNVAPSTTLLLYAIPGYTTYDGAIGVSKDNWSVQLSGQNLTNEYGPSNVTSGQFIKSEIPLRPRVLTLMLGYRF